MNDKKNPLKKTGKVLSLDEAREKRQRYLQEPIPHPLDAFGDPSSIRGFNELTDEEKAKVQTSFVEGNDFMMYVQEKADYVMELAQKIRDFLETLPETENGALVAALMVNATAGLYSIETPQPVASIIFTSIYSQFSQYMAHNSPPPKSKKPTSKEKPPAD